MRRPRTLPAVTLAIGLVAVAGAQPAPLSSEFVRLTTADGAQTAGLVYAPPGRVPRGGVALVHGFGGNFYSGVPAHLSRELAEGGFVTIAVNLRDHDAGPKTTLFEATRWDVQAAVDELTRRGVSPLALVGQSLGTNSVLFYVTATQDPRIRAVVLLSGPGSAFEWNVRLLGRERATQVLEEAQRLQAEGRGKELILVELGPLGKALYSADHLVSLRGPQSLSDPFRNIARVTTPILLVYGAADRLLDLEVGRRLKAAATRAPRADLVEIAGADHGFSKHQGELTATVERWLADALRR